MIEVKLHYCMTLSKLLNQSVNVMEVNINTAIIPCNAMKKFSDSVNIE